MEKSAFEGIKMAIDQIEDLFLTIKIDLLV